MAGTTDSRTELMPPYVFDLAKPEDDADLRRLLRTNHMEGDVTITMEREPNFFSAEHVMGDVHQTLVGRLQSENRIIALGTRSVRKMTLHGGVQSLGYLSELRVDQSYRGSYTFIRDGYAALDRIGKSSPVPFYLTSIVSDNQRARRLLEMNRKGMPTYKTIGTYYSLIIPTRRSKKNPPRTMRTATERDVPAITAFLNREYRRFTWAPLWNPENFANDTYTPGLNAEDILLAEHGGKICGCMSLWNQQTFRQIVIQSYRGSVARWRPVINLAARMRGLPKLPACGRPWKFAYISPMAIESDHPDVFTSLLQETISRASDKGYDHVLLGLSEKHPLLDTARRLVPLRREFNSTLYMVYWGDMPDRCEEIINAVPHPEIALL